MRRRDRKSTRLNSSHRTISYAVFCLKKKKKEEIEDMLEETNINTTISIDDIYKTMWSILIINCAFNALSAVAGISFFFFLKDAATPEIYTLSLHDALPI